MKKSANETSIYSVKTYRGEKNKPLKGGFHESKYPPDESPIEEKWIPDSFGFQQ